MQIRARTKKNALVLDLFGRVDVNSANLVEAVSHCLRDGYKNIVCNFAEVEFIDYLGVSAIAIIYKEITNQDGRMKFANIPAHLRNIFSITGLDRVIEIYSSEELAINALKEDKIIEDIKRMQLRRRFKRLPIGIKVELKGRQARKPVCIKVNILNLSAQGAYIFGCENFRLGDEVVLKFKLPPKNEEFQVHAKVVWLPDKQIQLHLQPGMGVEFVDLPGELQEVMVKFVERNVSHMTSDE
ncbi:MAG: anti-sigma factor antagonist [Candidatus Omnitrophica bacterium]|nr:anti-sigma factor antagonist [Candidatus Omnitrophota bacterium]